MFVGSYAPPPVSLTAPVGKPLSWLLKPKPTRDAAVAGDDATNPNANAANAVEATTIDAILIPVRMCILLLFL